MTRTPHDQFAKLCLAGFLEPFGVPEIGREVISEVQEVDVWFAPNSSQLDAQRSLGLLGRMVQTQCLLEPFRNSVQEGHILDCQDKLNAVRLELTRKAKSQKTQLPKTKLPRLWILSPSVSQAVLQDFHAGEKPDWPSGVFFLPKAQRLALIAIGQLPNNPETLWLRLLGRDGVQNQAIVELMALPASHPFRSHALEQLANLRITLQARHNLDKDERGLIMSLSPVYERWQEETIQKGIQEGKQERSRELVESFLFTRFGAVDPELATLVLPLAQLPDAEFTALMMQLADLSRESLLQRFQK
jgi:hypothetical protein